jgi:transposase IS66 family protein
MEKTLAQVAGGETIANVIRYALNRWDGLARFLDDGRIEIDSNTVEHAICPVCSEQKKCVIRWQRRRSGTLGDAGLADRDLQTARRQSVSLSERRADQARDNSPNSRARRTHTLGLGCRTLIGRGKQNRPVKPSDGGRSSSLVRARAQSKRFGRPPITRAASAAVSRLLAAGVSIRKTAKLHRARFHGSADQGNGPIGRIRIASLVMP